MFASHQLLMEQLKIIWTYLMLQEKTKDFIADYHIGIIREGKLMVRMQITDMEKMQEIMSFNEMKVWDEKFNCVDELYPLEKMN